MPEAHDPYGAIRSPGYRRLLGGNMLASIASQMQSVAVGWELWRRTGSPEALGLMGLVQFFPVILLALPAGQVADRYSRKALIVSAQGLLAWVSLALAALSWWQGPVELTYLCLLIGGVGQAFNSPARWALVPQVVPVHALTNAITWNSGGWQVASMLGPALGGLILAATGQAVGAYLLASACSFTCAALVWPIQPRSQPRNRQPITLTSLVAGAAFVARTKLILATITLDLFAVLFGGATVLLPIFAEEILGVGAVGLGLLRAAPAVGAFLMALLLAYRPPLRRAGLTMLWAVAGFGCATVVFGLSQSFLLSFGMLAVTGALDNISVVVRGTLVQVLTPDAMRGRVSAVNSIFIASSNQLGDFESGITAGWFGPVWSVVGGGLGTILVVLAVMWKWPEVLRLGSLQASVAAAEPNQQGAVTTEGGPPS